MDPQQAWTNLCNALDDDDYWAAREAADALSGWLRKGGFPPVTLGDHSAGNQKDAAICRLIHQALMCGRN